jgi:hypothetical protein
MSLDYQQPDYKDIFEDRNRRLELIESDPKYLQACKIHYETHPWDFISDWGFTFEPRNVERGLIASIPFVLWPKQVEYLKWVHARWRAGERGIVEKSRDCGVTWLSVGYAVSMFLFVEGFSVGFGSRKEELVDKIGNPDSIFEKIRHFYKNIPHQFLPIGYIAREHSAYMRLSNPEKGGSITGEGGDNIGRGGRKSMYLVDEAAFIDRQEVVDKALSQNTNCQIDISTPNGNGNAFYKKRQRFNNTDRIFVFDWRDDPRKDQDWYDLQCEEQDEVTVAQEIDRDYNASQEDTFIPAKWVSAAIDAHLRLGFVGEGLRTTGFDPADVGDAKSVCNRHGSVVEECKQLISGDITQAIPWAFNAADNFRADMFGFDADGMGAPTMKMQLTTLSVDRMKIIPYYGSAGVADPEKPIHQVKKAKASFKAGTLEDKLRNNADTYLNFRAQSWTWLRNRFESTYIAVTRATKGHVVDIHPDELISLSSSCEGLHELQAELSRPKRLFTNNGKIKVEAKKDMKKRGVDSPNLADALVIAMSIKAPKVKRFATLEYDEWDDPMP